MTPTKPKLKALLVSIGNYPKNPLKGCYYDVRLVKKFLKDQYKDQPKDLLNIKCLENEEAGRDHFIDTFLSFFKDLEDNDEALFYFSGHGSDIEAPKEFCHNNARKRLETLVLFDSRSKDGWDLVDKELAYLIWKVTQNKKVMMTVVVDSCHSGDIVRDNSCRVRHQSPSGKRRTWDEFLGHEEYLVDKNGDGSINVTVPKGHSILLGACRPTESSVEKYMYGFIHGVFTYSLIKTLKQSKGQLSYLDLINQTEIKVFQKCKEQHPQLVSQYVRDESRLFLGGVVQTKSKMCRLYFNTREQAAEKLPKGWLLKAGVMDGLSPIQSGDSQNGGHLIIYDPEQFDSSPGASNEKVAETYFLTVLTNHSLIQLQDIELDKDKEYLVFVCRPPATLMPFAFTNDCDPNVSHIIKEAFDNRTKDHLNLVAEAQEADYLIHTQNHEILIRQSGGNIANTFPYFRSFRSAAAEQLLDNLTSIAKWHKVREIQNLRSDILKEHLEITLFEVLEHSHDMITVNQEEPILHFFREAPTLQYQFNKVKVRSMSSNEKEPRIRLKIKHKEDSPYKELWVSVLYLGANYSVSNQLLQKEVLKQGHEQSLQYFHPKHEVQTSIVPLHLDKNFLKKGIHEITEHVKILVSTHDFSTNNLNQEGISQKTQRTNTVRNTSSSQAEEEKKKEQKMYADWTSFDFSIRIQYNKNT